MDDNLETPHVPPTPRSRGRPPTVPDELRIHLYQTVVNMKAKHRKEMGAELSVSQALRILDEYGGCAEVVGGSATIPMCDPEERVQRETLLAEQLKQLGIFRCVITLINPKPKTDQSNRNKRGRQPIQEYAVRRLTRDANGPCLVVYRSPSYTSMRNMYVKKRSELYPSARARYVNEAYERAGLEPPNTASFEELDAGLGQVVGD